MQRAVSVKAVVVRDDRVLLARNDRGEWELPGGRMEPDEQPEQTVAREVLEETGLVVDVAELIAVREFEPVPGTAVLLVIHRAAERGREDVVVSSEHRELRWVRVSLLDQEPLPAVYADAVRAVALPGRVVLLGDSHLSRFDRSRLVRLRDALPGRPVVSNHAFGGATAPDVAEQLTAAPLLPSDHVVLSVGTNDCAPWKAVPIEVFREALDAIAASLGGRRVLVLDPPSSDVDAQRALRPRTVRTEADRKPYAEAVLLVATRERWEVVRVPRTGVHDTGGVHLDDHGYDLLIDGIADGLRLDPAAPG